MLIPVLDFLRASRTTFSSLFEHVLVQLHPIICRLASRDVTERNELLGYSSILFLWSRAIAFGRYLDHPSMTYL